MPSCRQTNAYSLYKKQFTQKSLQWTQWVVYSKSYLQLWLSYLIRTSAYSNMLWDATKPMTFGTVDGKSATIIIVDYYNMYKNTVICKVVTVSFVQEKIWLKSFTAIYMLHVSYSHQMHLINLHHMFWATVINFFVCICGVTCLKTDTHFLRSVNSLTLGRRWDRSILTMCCSYLVSWSVQSRLEVWSKSLLGVNNMHRLTFLVFTFISCFSSHGPKKSPNL